MEKQMGDNRLEIKREGQMGERERKGEERQMGGNIKREKDNK